MADGTVGGSITFFIVVAGIHTPLVDAGIVETPIMISVVFLAILLALSYQVADDAARSRRYRRDRDRMRRRLDRLVRDGQARPLEHDGKTFFTAPEDSGSLEKP